MPTDLTRDAFLVLETEHRKVHPEGDDMCEVCDSLDTVRAALDALDRIRQSIRPAFGPTAMAQWERIAADPIGLANLVDASVNGVPNDPEEVDNG